MIRTNYAYRHQNGQVEGFSAFRFAQPASSEACLAEIRRKCEEIGQPFDEARIIKENKGLTADELKMVRADWGTYRGPGDGPDPLTGKTGFFG